MIIIPGRGPLHLLEFDAPLSDNRLRRPLFISVVSFFAIFPSLPVLPFFRFSFSFAAFSRISVFCSDTVCFFFNSLIFRALGQAYLELLQDIAERQAPVDVGGSDGGLASFMSSSSSSLGHPMICGLSAVLMSFAADGDNATAHSSEANRSS